MDRSKKLMEMISLSYMSRIIIMCSDSTMRRTDIVET